MAMEVVGIDNIIGHCELYKASPFYAIFECANAGGRSQKAGRLIYTYKGGDKDGEGLEFLKQNLQGLSNSAPTIAHIIQFYDALDKRGTITDSSPYAGSFLFRIQPFTGIAPVGAIGGIMPQENPSFLAYLQTQLLEANTRIRDLEEENLELKETIDDLDQPAPQIKGIIGQIGEAGNAFPWMADIIKDWSTIFKHKVSSMNNNNTGRPAGAMAGVGDDAPPDQRVNAAIKQLIEFYVKKYGEADGWKQFAADMQLLASLTEDEDMFNVAIKKLRALG